ncbi:MAG: prolipoprotein diacylglyceryl transferase family protein [Bacteroidota bacterium]
MFPQVTDIFNYLFGTHLSLPIQSYGFFVALAFLIGAYTIKLELKRKEKQGRLHIIIKKELKGAPASLSDLIIVGIFGFAAGYKIVGVIFDYATFADNPQTYIFSSKGNWIGAIVLAVGMIIWRYYTKKKEQLDKPVIEEKQVHPYQLTGNILIISAIAGLLGAKIFHNLENFGDLINDPIGSIFSFMGLTFYGGLILGTAAVLWYARKNKISIIELLDASSPGIMISYGIGRMGCMTAGDGCWGIANLNPKPEWLSWLPDWMWAFNFPHNVVGEGVPLDPCTGKFCTILEHPVYPTSFYDFVLCLTFFIVLWSLRKKINIPGVLFSIMLFIIGIQRFFMEKIRVNNKYHFLGIDTTQAEIISVLLIILAIIGFWFFYKKKQKIPKKRRD